MSTVAQPRPSGRLPTGRIAALLGAVPIIAVIARVVPAHLNRRPPAATPWATPTRRPTTAPAPSLRSPAPLTHAPRAAPGRHGKALRPPRVVRQGCGGGVTDIFLAAVQFEKIGANSSQTAQVVLAGVVGLLAVGLILLGVGMVGRRKADPASAAASKGKTQAGVG